MVGSHHRKADIHNAERLLVEQQVGLEPSQSVQSLSVHSDDEEESDDEGMGHCNLAVSFVSSFCDERGTVQTTTGGKSYGYTSCVYTTCPKKALDKKFGKRDWGAVKGHAIYQANHLKYRVTGDMRASGHN